jgi:hypothetical protein
MVEDSLPVFVPSIGRAGYREVNTSEDVLENVNGLMEGNCRELKQLLHTLTGEK